MTEAKEMTKGQRRQAEILAAARKLLVEEGYDRFALREIAARLGMQLGNLQYYFATREQLLEAVMRAESLNDLALFEEVTGSDESAESQLRALTRTLLRHWSGASGGVYAAASFLALHQERFRKLQHGIYDRFYDHLLPVLKNIHPQAPKSSLLTRVRLITALWDGALIQLHCGTFAATKSARDRFVEDVCRQVVVIASM